MDGLLIRGPVDGQQRTAALEFLRAQGYRGAVAAADAVFVALHDRDIVGVVRLADEAGVTVLRGMRVRDDLWGRRIGRRLLAHVASTWNGRACYCLPYRWLAGFYGASGFRACPEAELPSHLADRLREYRERGLDVIGMVRTARRASGVDNGTSTPGPDAV